jgi:hypothetical protein
MSASLYQTCPHLSLRLYLMKVLLAVAVVVAVVAVVLAFYV